MNIPFLDLTAQYTAIRGEIDDAIAAVIRDTAFIGGPYVKTFEQQFGAYCGTRYAYGVSNGTDAIRVALLAAGVRAGDEVITVPNTFIATAEAITMIGAHVRFVDIEPETATMGPDALAHAITHRTKAVVPVHLHGHVAHMDQIMAVARARGLKVVADAAQAHGASDGGRAVGTLGDAVTFSFYPGKNLGAYGDAGAVVTNDPAIAERVALLRDHGRTKKYEHLIEGFNCRLDGLQAAILTVKLRHLPAWTEQRRRCAALYTELLADAPGLTVPIERPGSCSVYHLYAVRTKHRDALQVHLNAQGIGTGVHYPIPLHRQPAYAYLGLREGSLPVAEQYCRETLSLPIYAELTDEQIRFVAQKMQRALEQLETRVSA